MLINSINMSNKSSLTLLAFSPQDKNTLYLTALAGLGSSAAALIALAFFKPTNLGQNDLHYDWKTLSLLSALGSTVTLHYGVTGTPATTSLWSSLTSLFSK